jgi:type IVB pilus formation R64 PilN family outer membrane protein
MFKKPRLISASVATIVALAGCSNTATQHASIQLDRSNQRASENMVASRVQGTDVQSGSVRMKKGIYLAGNVSQNDRGTGLPPEWKTKTVKFVSSRPLGFREVADMITSQTNISVIARSDIPTQNSRAANTSKAAADLTSSPNPNAPKLAQGPQPAGFDPEEALKNAAGYASSEGQGGLPQISSTEGTMVVNYSGKLSDFLDRVGDNFNYAWSYENGTIQFSRSKIATFDIPALPMVIKLAFSLDSGMTSSNSGEGVSQDGGSSQKASTDAAFNVWEDINKTLKSIVGNSGTIDISGSTGTVTINAPAVTIRQARDYIKRINRELSRQIVLSVNVYSVKLKESDNYDFNLNAAFSDGNIALNGGTKGSSAITDAAGLLASATGASSGAGFAIINPNSKWAGTNGVVQALSSQGDTSIVTSANLTTLNGIPAPFQVVNTRGYVSEVSTTTTGGSDTTSTTLTPKTVTTGFNLYIVPRVDQNGRVMLQYGINISELAGANDGFDTFSTGGQTVQLPNINARNFVQEAAVPIGGTLIVTGFEQKSAATSASGAGKAKIPLLGGGRAASAGREMVVIAVSPRVIQLGSPKAID